MNCFIPPPRKKWTVSVNMAFTSKNDVTVDRFYYFGDQGTTQTTATMCMWVVRLHRVYILCVPEGTIWLSIVRFSTRMNHLVINRAVLYQIFIFIYRMVLCQREFEQTSQLLYKNPKTNRFRPAGAVPSKDDFQCLVLKSKGQTSEVLTAVRQYSYYFIIFT